jgi:hypothetical protein
MRFTDIATNRMLDALDESQATGAKYGSLHTAYSSTGANEVTGGSPAYARQALTWAAAVLATRSKAATVAAAFNVPASTTVRWVGLWVTASAGTPATDFLGMVPNGGAMTEAFTMPDTGLDVLKAPSHGFSTNQTVVVWSVPGAPLPSPLTEGTVYYVISATADDLQLSTTLGGGSVPLTTVGSGFLQRIVEEVFGAQGTMTVTSYTMTLD